MATLYGGQDYPNRFDLPATMKSDDDALGVQGVPFPQLMDFFTGGAQQQNQMIGDVTNGTPPSVGAANLRGVQLGQDSQDRHDTNDTQGMNPLMAEFYNRQTTQGGLAASPTSSRQRPPMSEMQERRYDMNPATSGVSDQAQSPLMMPPPVGMQMAQAGANEPGPGSSLADTSPSWGSLVPLIGGLAGFMAGRSTQGNPNDMINAMVHTQRAMNQPRALTNQERERLRIQQELGKALPHMSSEGLKQMLPYARQYGMGEMVLGFLPGAVAHEKENADFARGWESSGGVGPPQAQQPTLDTISQPEGQRTSSMPAPTPPIAVNQPPKDGSQNPPQVAGQESPAPPDTFSTRIGQEGATDLAGPGQTPTFQVQGMPSPLAEQPPMPPRPTRSMHQGEKGITRTINSPGAADYAAYDERMSQFQFDKTVSGYVKEMRQNDKQTGTPILLEQARQRAAEELASQGKHVPKGMEQYLNVTDAARAQSGHALVKREVDTLATRLFIQRGIQARETGQPMTVEPGAFSKLVDQVAIKRNMKPDDAMNLKHELANTMTALTLQEVTDGGRRAPTQLEVYNARQMVAPWFGNNVPDDWAKMTPTDMGLKPEDIAAANRSGNPLGNPAQFGQAMDAGQTERTFEGGLAKLQTPAGTAAALQAGAGRTPTDRAGQLQAAQAADIQTQADTRTAVSEAPTTLVEKSKARDGLYADAWLALQYGKKLKEDLRLLPGALNSPLSKVMTIAGSPNKMLNDYLVLVSEAFNVKRLESAGMTLTQSEKESIIKYLPSADENFATAFPKLENLERVVGDIVRKDMAQFSAYGRSKSAMPEIFRNYTAAHSPLEKKAR